MTALNAFGCYFGEQNVNRNRVSAEVFFMGYIYLHKSGKLLKKTQDKMNIRSIR